MSKITKARPVALKPRYWISVVVLKASDYWWYLLASHWKSPPLPSPPLSLAYLSKERDSPLLPVLRHALGLRVRLRTHGSPNQSLTRAAQGFSQGAAIRKDLSSTPIQHTSRYKELIVLLGLRAFSQLEFIAMAEPGQEAGLGLCIYTQPSRWTGSEAQIRGPPWKAEQCLLCISRKVRFKLLLPWPS